MIISMTDIGRCEDILEYITGMSNLEGEKMVKELAGTSGIRFFNGVAVGLPQHRVHISFRS